VRTAEAGLAVTSLLDALCNETLADLQAVTPGLVLVSAHDADVHDAIDAYFPKSVQLGASLPGCGEPHGQSFTRQHLLLK
jgi:hypothetical protein